MSMSHGESSSMPMRSGKCHVCGDTGHYVDCSTKSDAASKKVVHNEMIGLITVKQDPVLSKMRRRGWYLASRCSVHVCNSRDMFVDYHSWTNHWVVMDSNEHAEVAGIGTVVLRFTTGKVLTLRNVFHMPVGIKCLVSLGKLAKTGLEILIGPGGAVIKRNHEIVGKAFDEDGLLRLSLVEVHKETIGLLTTHLDNTTITCNAQGWFLSSRATVHVCNSRDMFVDYLPWSGHEVVLDNSEHAEVAGIGTVKLQFTTGKVMTLTNVFHMPAITKCLVSIGKLDENGCSVSFGAGEVVISKSGEVFGKGYNEGGLYRLSIVEGYIYG